MIADSRATSRFAAELVRLEFTHSAPTTAAGSFNDWRTEATRRIPLGDGLK